jgi:hypothetical protein
METPKMEENYSTSYLSLHTTHTSITKYTRDRVRNKDTVITDASLFICRGLIEDSSKTVAVLYNHRGPYVRKAKRPNLCTA